MRVSSVRSAGFGVPVGLPTRTKPFHAAYAIAVRGMA
jgi:hypothetical protein